jgi:hypothetical protein
VRGDTHAGCGERSGETGRWQHRNRAPDRLNIRGRRLPGGTVMPTASINSANVLAIFPLSRRVSRVETKKLGPDRSGHW